MNFLAKVPSRAKLLAKVLILKSSYIVAGPSFWKDTTSIDSSRSQSQSSALVKASLSLLIYLLIYLLMLYARW